MLKLDQIFQGERSLPDSDDSSSSIATVPDRLHKSLDIADRAKQLERLGRNALVLEWTRINKRHPPLNLSRALLLKAVAYQLQEFAHGGLKNATRERLRKIAAGVGGEKDASAQLNSGTRLLREWHGVTHEVVIEEKGARYQGKVYHSLSEVARVITGTKWSGPVFFGLRKRSK